MWRPPKNAPNSEKCTKFGLRISEGYHQSRGLINYKETKAKCPHPKKLPIKGFCLSEFIDRRYSQSCWYFRIFVCPSNLLSGSTPPLFTVRISVLYICIQWVRGGGYIVLGLRQ